METKKVAKEYLQKDILRTIFQMRKRQEDDKQIKKMAHCILIMLRSFIHRC